MSLLTKASSRIVSRGYSYYKAGKVFHIMQLNDHEYEGDVQGTLDTPYHVKIDVNHIRKSSCDCPYANGGIICKHMVALYFAVFPDEAEDYEEWLYSDDVDEEEYDEFDDYEDEEDYEYHYSSRFEKPLFYDYVLDLFIHDLSESDAKSMLKNELSHDEERTYYLYLEKRYQEILKKNNKTWMFLDKINRKLKRLKEIYIYDYQDYSIEILNDHEKKQIEKLYNNDELKKVIDEILLVPKLAVYDDYQWIAHFYKNNKTNINDFYKELEKYMSQLKSYHIKDSTPKSNVLITMYILSPCSLRKCAISLLKNSKYTDYIKYVINDSQDYMYLYHEVMKEIHRRYFKYKRNIPSLLKVFMSKDDCKNQDMMYQYGFYSFLCDGDIGYLKYLENLSTQDKIIKDVESTIKNAYLLIHLYSYFNEKEKLWTLLNKNDNKRLLIHHVQLLKDSYGKELHQYFLEQFYLVLEKGKKREIYHQACQYVKAMYQLNDGQRLVNRLVNDLNYSEYQKCTALFDEIKKAKK